MSIQKFKRNVVAPGFTGNVPAADIPAGSVGNTELASGAAAANLGTGGVTSTLLAAGSAAANLGTGGVTTALLASQAVTAAKTARFVSTVQTGTGSSMNIAHGLGTTPVAVFVSFTGSTATQAVTEGSHTSTDVVVTVTTGATFKVIAFA